MTERRKERRKGKGKKRKGELERRGRKGRKGEGEGMKEGRVLMFVRLEELLTFKLQWLRE